MRRVIFPIATLAAALALAGCGGDGGGTKTAVGTTSARPSCPQAWRAGWQRLANEVGSPVYCPSWLPKPINGKIDGVYRNGRWVDKQDKSYLVSFLWVDRDAGVSREVHVNFRGYPNRTKVPTCQSTHTVESRTVRKAVPCFADRQGAKRLGDIEATVYTVNQGIDEWHVLYAWRRSGSLYTVSEHVAPPFSYNVIVRNLDRMTRSLALLEPSA